MLPAKSDSFSTILDASLKDSHVAMAMKASKTAYNTPMTAMVKPARSLCARRNLTCTNR